MAPALASPEGMLFLLALACRLAYAVLLHRTPAGRDLLIDSAFYAARAGAIARGEGFGPGPYFMNPGYPYLLAPLHALGAGGPLAVGIVQSLAGALAALGLGRLARRWFGPRAGRVAFVLAALYGPFWFYDGAILTASPILAGSILLLVLLERLAERPGRRLALLAGALAGGIALLRPTILLFVAALPWLLAGAAPERSAARRRRRLGFLLWAGAALAIAPVTLRNFMVAGEPVLISTSLGMNFYTGHHPGATGVYAGAPFVTSYEPEFERADFQREAERRTGRQLSAAEASRFWFGEGVRSIAADPLAAARREVAKLLLAFHHVEAQNNLSIYLVRDWVPLLRFDPLGFRLVAPLGLAGLVLLRGRARRALLGLGFGASHLLAMLLFFVSSEYRLPLLVLLIPAAAAFLVAASDRLRGRAVLPRAALVLLVLGILLANRETPLTRRLASRRVDYLNFATLAEARGDVEGALALLDRALVIDPAFAPALRRQVDLARRAGLDELRAAAQARLAALTPAPAPEADILLWDVDRAVDLYRAGRHADALDVFARLARDRPRDVRLLNNIGLCLYKLGRLGEAEAAFRRAMALDPAYTRAEANLGLVLRAAGRPAAAEAAWRAVLAREPGNRMARIQLSRLHGAQGGAPGDTLAGADEPAEGHGAGE